MKIGIVQLTSSLEFSENLEKIQKAIDEALKLNVEAIFLPECFYSMSDGKAPTPYLVENGNEHFENIRSLAVKNKIFILGGSAATKGERGVLNRAFNFSPSGEDLGFYDKNNLFSCDIKKSDGTRKTIDEGDIYTPGTKRSLINAGPFKIGLGICFDLRFPNFSYQYALEGANLLTFSSAFTVPSGRAHWHTLVRARAIETQCFVVAPAQWGVHNDKIITYGHSLIVDPWGRVLADAGEGEKLITADIDLNLIQDVRDSIKCFS